MGNVQPKAQHVLNPENVSWVELSFLQAVPRHSDDRSFFCFLFGRLASSFLSEARIHATGDKEVLAGDVGGILRH
jgi:hypothetical protein